MSEAPEKSRSYRLKSGEPADEGVARVARTRAEIAVTRLRQDARDDLPGAVHDARKDLKKVRAVLRLVRGGLGKKAYRSENRRYRDAGRMLASSRDAEVKLETLRALRRRYPEEAPPAESLERSLEHERERLAGADGALAARLEDAALTIAAGGAASGLELDGSGWALVGPGVERTYRDGCRRLADLRSDPTAEAVHEWRKRVKDLWYQVRLLREAWPDVMSALAAQLRELSELLGDHHDLTLLAEEARARSARDDGGQAALLELIARRQGELLDAALAIGDRVYAESPGLFGDRMAAYWRAWRADEP